MRLLFLIVIFNLYTTSKLASQTDAVDRLVNLSKQRYLLFGDLATADSLSRESVELAFSTIEKKIQYKALLAYLTRDKYGNPNNIDSYIYKKSVALLDEETDPLMLFKLRIALANRLAQSHFSDEARNYSRKAMGFAAAKQDPSIKIEAYLAVFRTTLQQGENQEAYQHLLDASNLLLKLDDDEMELYQEKLMDATYDFFFALKSFTKAQKYKWEIIYKIQQSQPIDSTKLMWAFYDICQAAAREDNEIQIGDRLKLIIAYATSKKNILLERYSRATYRGHLVNSDNLDEFHQEFRTYYEARSLNHLNYIRSADDCLSNAFFCVRENKQDSAVMYFNLAIDMAYESKNNHRIANYHRRFGRYLLSIHKDRMAYEQLKKALEYSLKADYSNHLLEITSQLDTLAMKFGEYEKANEFNRIRIKTLENNKENQIGETLLMMELDNQKRMNDERQEMQLEKEKRKYNIQYFAIAVGLIIIFLLLIILSSMSVPNWLIQMLGFFSILFIFEFIILILDSKIHNWAHGEPIKIFLVKILILSVLFPLHHVIEHGVTTYMIKNQLIKRPKKTAFRKFIKQLYPWLKENDQPDSHSS